MVPAHVTRLLAETFPVGWSVFTDPDTEEFIVVGYPDELGLPYFARADIFDDAVMALLEFALTAKDSIEAVTHGP